MAKEGKEKEPDDKKETAEAKEKVEERTDKKVESAVDKGASKKEAVNIIGDITPPKDPENPDDVKAYFKKIDEKLDKLLSGKDPPKEPETAPPAPPEKKAPWYDRPVF